MKKEITILLLLFCSALTFWISNTKKFTAKNDFIIDGIAIDRRPCLELLSNMFEKSLDSIKTCDCLLTNFYETIKGDSVQKTRFKNFGMFALASPYNDTFKIRFSKCVLNNIVDTSYKIKFNGIFKEIVITELRSEWKNYKEFENINEDSAINCLLKRLDQRITIKEFYEGNENAIEKHKAAFKECLSAYMNSLTK